MIKTKKNNFFLFLKNHLFDNFKIKFICFIIALSLYISVGLFIKRSSKIFTTDLKIENLKENLIIANNIPHEIKITVLDNQEVLNKIEEKDFNVRLDLSEIQEPEKNRIKLKWDVPSNIKSLFSNVKIEPNILDIETDEIAEKNVGIIINTVGHPAPGYIEKKAIIEPSTVRIQGPKSILEKIKSVRTEKISLEGVKETFSRQVLLVSDFESVIIIGKANILFDIEEDIGSIKLYFYDANYNNLRETLKASITDEIEVILKGSKNSIKTLSKDNISITIDCSGVISTGDYMLPVVVKKPGEFEATSIKPEKIKVYIERNR